LITHQNDQRRASKEGEAIKKEIEAVGGKVTVK
jgi:hypothetical protein